MKVGIYGRKVGMTQIFDESGAATPVTVIDASQCFVTQIKSKEKDGYTALQVGMGDRKPQNINKAKAGHFKKAGIPGKAKLAEIPVEEAESIKDLKPSHQIKVNVFAKGDKVDVTGISKGKGFAGVMKRHNFHGTKASHGVHEFFRHGGSVGSTTFPGRIWKNLKMPGQLGNEKATIQNLEVVEVKEKENVLLLKGAVPGGKNSYVFIQSAKKRPAPENRSY